MVIANTIGPSGAGVAKSTKQNSPTGQDQEKETQGLDAEKNTKEESSSVKAKTSALKSSKVQDGIQARVPNKKAFEDIINETERPNFGVEKSSSSNGSGSAAGGQGGSGQQSSSQQPNFGNNPPSNLSGGSNSGINGSNQANNGWLGQQNVQPPSHGHHNQAPSLLDNVSKFSNDVTGKFHEGHWDLAGTTNQNNIDKLNQIAGRYGQELSADCKDGVCKFSISPHEDNNSTQEFMASNEKSEPPPLPPEPPPVNQETVTTLQA